MKYAIMSDVHANPEALKAALADAHDFGCERFVLCGDVTGYGYDVVGAMIKPEKNARYIINVGSVGYPRHDLCSTYAIYDSRSRTITLRRLPFDFNHYLTQMSMRKIAIPDRLSRLLAGAPWRRVPE